MTFQIVNITKQEREKEFYFTFSLCVTIPDWGEIITKGWKYFPSTGQIGAPSANRGKNRWVQTAWLKGRIWDVAALKIQDYFVLNGFCVEPFETTEQRRASKKRPKTQEEWNEQQLDKLAKKGKKK